MLSIVVAQGPLQTNQIIWPLIVITFVVIFVGMLMLLAKRYKRCPSNRILVIYGRTGKGRAARSLHGGGTFVWPLIQAFDFLSLDPMKIDIPLQGALSMENIRVAVPSVFTVAIGTDTEAMTNAAIRLLGLQAKDIMKQAEDIIFGQLRQVIASMRIEEINRDRDVFLQKIQVSLEPELKKIGLVLINVNIKDITDESGYIEAIGRKAAAEAIQQAQIDVAQQEQKGAIGVANAEQERAVQVATAARARDIGTTEAERDRAVKVADLARERIVGEKQAEFTRDAAVREAERQMRVQVAEANAKAVAGEKQAEFNRDATVKEAERQMRVQVAEANAKAVTGENTAKAVIAQSNAELRVREATAYQSGESRYREAEAAVREAQYRAEAQAALAQADKIEAEKRAELEASAKAIKAQTIVDAEAVAAKVRIEAEGQAAAIFAKLEAEARGQYEILAKKGEGLRAIVSACGGAEQAFQMLMLEHLDKLSETAAKAISGIKFDKVVVWDGGNGQGSGTAGFLRGLGSALPPMMQIMKDIGGVELPEYFAKLVREKEEARIAKPDGPPAGV